MRSSSRSRPLLVLGLVAAALLVLLYWTVGRSSAPAPASPSASASASASLAAGGARAQKSLLRPRASLKCLLVGPDANADANPAALLRPLVLSANQHMPKARLVVLVRAAAAAAKQSAAGDGEQKEEREGKRTRRRCSHACERARDRDRRRGARGGRPSLSGARALRGAPPVPRVEQRRGVHRRAAQRARRRRLPAGRVRGRDRCHGDGPESRPERRLLHRHSGGSDSFGTNSRASALLHTCAGEKVLHRLAASRELFAGVVAGTRMIVIAYVRAMESLLARLALGGLSQLGSSSASSGSGSGVTSAFHHVVLRFNALGDALPDALANEREHLRALLSSLRLVARDEQALVLDVERTHSFNVDASGEQVRAGDAHDRPLPALLYGHRRNALLALLLARKYAIDAPAAPAAAHPSALRPPANGPAVAL